MRASIPLAVALFVMMPAAAETVMEDPSGDVATSIAGQTVPSLASHDTVDLLRLDIDEDVESIRFAVALGDAEASQENGERVQVVFTHNDQPYYVSFNRDTVDAQWVGRVSAQAVGEDFYVVVAELPVEVDDDSVAMVVDRVLLVDRSGATPTIGRTLDAVHVRSFGSSVLIYNASGDDPGLQTTDLMQGPSGPIPVPMRFGLMQSGDARLSSERPFRTSNGAATTFVYDVVATNLADEEHVYSFDLHDVPAQWEMSLPYDTISIPAGGTRPLSVVVQSPFAHKHGARETFGLEMHSQQDPNSIGRVQLGVLYPEVPQPAGHHDTLHLHTQQDPLTDDWLLEAVGGGGRDEVTLTMNTLQDDPEDIGQPVASGRGNYRDFQQDLPLLPTLYTWDAPLQPALAMGLLFNAEDTGTIEVPLRVQQPNQGAWLEGEIVWQGPNTDPGGFNEVRTEVQVATFASGPHDLPEGTVTTLTAPLEATDNMTVPYAPGARLAIRIHLAIDAPEVPVLAQAAQAELMPGAWFRLPLLEYEDALDEVFTDTGLAYEATDTTQMVNPGGTARYEIRTDVPVDVAMLGSNKDWAKLLGDSRQTRMVDLVVNAPPGALDGDRADIVLELTAADGSRAFVRLLTEVDTDEAHANAALAETHDRASPGAPLALALAAALFMRRR